MTTCLLRVSSFGDVDLYGQLTLNMPLNEVSISIIIIVSLFFNQVPGCTMSKVDFLSLDDDMDLDALLGEYTEDDDRDKVSSKTSKRTLVWMVTRVLFVTGFLR
jgi:hypothetical protein